MHTSSGVDNVDFFAETIARRDGKLLLSLRHGAATRRRVGRSRRLPRQDGRRFRQRAFTVYRTHHGPIVRRKDGKWVSVALMHKPVEALEQSYLRTKATDYAAFMKVEELRANSSNNTIFADDDGDIAYLHPQFIPRRDDRFDYTKPVDGSRSARPTGRGCTSSTRRRTCSIRQPAGIMNTNDWPYSAAGPDSPKREDFPRYMDTAGENPRGVHAAMLLQGRRDFTADSLNALAYDPYLPAFARLIPLLTRDQGSLPESSPERASLADPVRVLAEWDDRWSARFGRDDARRALGG